MVFEKYVWLRFFRPHSDRQGTQWWSWSHTRSVPRTSPVIVMVVIVILVAMLMMFCHGGGDDAVHLVHKPYHLLVHPAQ